MIRDRIEQLETGNAELDRILDGGLPIRSVTVVGGEPGTGKTVFALQMLFHQAKLGRRALYATTLSEPAIKLLRHLPTFSFYDETFISDRIIPIELGTVLLEQGLEAALAELSEAAEEYKPDIVVIDSFRALLDQAESPAASRAAAHQLSVELASWGATTLLLGEYATEEIADRSEFAIADGILTLSLRRDGLMSGRELEVRKLRGVSPILGRHFFDITQEGLNVYPRVRPPAIGDTREIVSTHDRASTGVVGLDELFAGGLPRQSTTLIEGATGTGKTILGLHYLLNGAQHGEPGVLFTLEETPEQLRGLARSTGLDLVEHESAGMLSVEYASPVELSPDRFLFEARRKIEQLGAKRVVLDSLTGLELGVSSERRFRELVYALAKHFREVGVTFVMTLEAPALLGSSQLASQGVLSSADNLVLLRYVELEGRLERAISVLKARGVAHATDLRRGFVGSKGFTVGEGFSDLQGVLTGVPTRSVPPPKRSRSARTT